MAKKSMVERELKRQKLVKKYEKKRLKIFEEFYNSTTYEEKLIIHGKLQKIPRMLRLVG